MAVIEIGKIQVRRGQENQTGIPQLDPGEFGWAEDTERLYIGKRIVEGANSDENTRVLTETDLDNIFNLINTTSSSILSYQYRRGSAHISVSSEITTVENKLNNFVNLTDFDSDLVPNHLGTTNITPVLITAINTLFYNSTFNSAERLDSRRVLRLPAGHYLISSMINLPPFTAIEGEGSGRTTLTFINSSTNMFSTIDADGTAFNGGMESGIKRARDISIKGLTLEYAITATSDYSLITLDNVLDVKLDDVEFRTEIDTQSTTTYGLISKGTGLSIRGTGGGIGAGDSNLCENIQLLNCKFDSLNTGVEGTGSIVRTIIENSVFTNLYNGIKMTTQGATPAPSNGHFKDNRFTNIVKEAIFIGTSSQFCANISENNSFYQVGNGVSLSDYPTTQQYPVIRFYSTGSKSINDNFNRQLIATTITNSSWYFNPIMQGNGSVVDNTVFSKDLALSTTTNITKFALSGRDQKIDLDYKIYTTNDSYLRTGKLLINLIDSVPAGTVSDYYNFNYDDSLWGDGDPDTAVFDITTSTNNSYVNLRFTNWSANNLKFEFKQSIS